MPQITVDFKRACDAPVPCLFASDQSCILAECSASCKGIDSSPVTAKHGFVSDMQRGDWGVKSRPQYPKGNIPVAAQPSTLKCEGEGSWLWQAVHSGADLQSAAALVLGCKQAAVKGKTILVEPVPNVATPAFKEIIHDALAAQQLQVSHQGSRVAIIQV